MAQRDYIIREIERLGAILAALKHRLLGGPAAAAEARAELDSFGETAGLNPILLRSLTADTLARMIGDRAGIDPTRCWLWAEFLYLDGFSAQSAADATAAHDRWRKALTLYGLLRAPFAGFLSEVPLRVAEIEGLLATDNASDKSAQDKPVTSPSSPPSPLSPPKRAQKSGGHKETPHAAELPAIRGRQRTLQLTVSPQQFGLPCLRALQYSTDEDALHCSRQLERIA
jgi:hypothetical protein